MSYQKITAFSSRNAQSEFKRIMDKEFNLNDYQKALSLVISSLGITEGDQLFHYFILGCRHELTQPKLNAFFLTCTTTLLDNKKASPEKILKLIVDYFSAATMKLFIHYIAEMAKKYFPEVPTRELYLCYTRSTLWKDGMKLLATVPVDKRDEYNNHVVWSINSQSFNSDLEKAMYTLNLWKQKDITEEQARFALTYICRNLPKAPSVDDIRNLDQDKLEKMIVPQEMATEYEAMDFLNLALRISAHRITSKEEAMMLLYLSLRITSKVQLKRQDATDNVLKIGTNLLQSASLDKFELREITKYHSQALGWRELRDLTNDGRKKADVGIGAAVVTILPSDVQTQNTVKSFKKIIDESVIATEAVEQLISISQAPAGHKFAGLFSPREIIGQYLAGTGNEANPLQDLGF